MLVLSKKTKIHFIGIGGIGMSGIAEVLLDLGHQVSGSDISGSSITEHLSGKGAEIYQGHQATNLKNVNLVVYSTAIDEKNPEVQQAKRDKIPLIRRAEMLAELMRLKKGIAIAGSHGKTTTTSMVATIFHEAELDATHIIGGLVSNLGGNARKGDGEFLIAEADESDGSFLLLSPVMAVVTNIDNDHLDYHKSEDNIRNAFTEFINNVPFFGRAMLNAFDVGIQAIIPNLKRPYSLFGISKTLDERQSLDYAADKVVYNPRITEFDVWHKGAKLGRVKTSLSGQHNVLNALAAIAVSHEAGIPFEKIACGISKFTGVGRRMESLWKNGNFEIIDDYGHHPTEIKVTLSTLKNVFKKYICVVFEPHRYTRTQQLWGDFVTSFSDADEIFISPIYAASEAALPGITGEKLAHDISKTKSHVTYLSNLDGLKELIESRQEKDMIFLTLGAGSISKKTKSVVKEL